MSSENYLINKKISESESISKTIQFFNQNPSCVKYISRVLEEQNKIQVKIKKFQKQLRVNDPLINSILKIILENFAINDEFIAKLNGVKISDIRQHFEFITCQLPDFFLLNRDNKRGWVIMLKDVK